MALLINAGKTTTLNPFCWEGVHLEKDKQDVTVELSQVDAVMKTSQEYLVILHSVFETPFHSR